MFLVNKSINVSPDAIEKSAQIDNINDADTISTMSYTDPYWWGVKWYLNKKEANYWQNRFSDYAFGWGAVSALAGNLGAPVASIAAIIMAVGNYYLYAELRDNTSSRGSVLVFKWAPPSVYAYKR